MNRFRISTPEGTRDLLFSSCRALRQTENAVREALEERGYSEIITPAVEYFDVFAQANPELDQDQMLKIIDKSGRICVARPDNTTPIARIAATRLDDAALPVRLYYSQKVFRSVSGDHGHKGEFLQVGAEFIGADGLAADKDILSAAFAALSRTGVDNFRIELGHAEIYKALIEELGAGEVVGGAVDVYPVKKEPITITYNVEKINALLGTDIDEDTMVAYFKKLDLTVDREKKEVLVPTWRQDLERLADLAEEVARFFGYDNIPMTLPSGSATAGGLSEKMQHENMARDIVEAYGFMEGMTFSFESPKVYDKLLLPADDVLRKSIAIMNPLGEDYSVMRTSAIGGMLTSLATNYNRRNQNVRLYELANVYLPKSLPLTELPEEQMQLTLGMYGEGDFFTMKGVVESLMQRMGLKKAAKYDPQAGKSFLHPGRQAKVIYEGCEVAYLGEIHPEVLDNFSIGQKAYIAVVNMKQLSELASFDVKYVGIPKFPAMTRDISLTMKKEVLAGDIEETIRTKGGKLIESVTLFDIYEGAQLTQGYKSMAYKIVFRAPDRTLKDEEVNKAMDKIVRALEEKEIVLRS